jgi:hypothetical protein
MGDLIIVLSTIAAAAALWFRWSSDRAAKRALVLIRRDAPQREPGLTLEIVRASKGEMLNVEIRLTNPAGAWNMVTGLYFEKSEPSQAFAAEKRDGALTVPLVIQAGAVITGSVFFRIRDGLREGSIVVVDLDERIVKSSVRV